MTRTHEHGPRTSEVVAARRLLGLGASAGHEDVEAAVSAARAAIRVPDDAPDLAPVAANLQRRIDHARTVLLATLPPMPSAPAAPPPPVPPPPPIAPRRERLIAGPPTQPAAEPGDGRAARAARTRNARQERSAHTRAGVHAVVLVVVLLVLGGAAFAITRALSRPGPVARGAASSTTTALTTPPTTLPAPTFADRLVSGALGRSPEGIAAESAQEALSTWLAAFQQEDADVVSRGLDTESRLMDLAEIGSLSAPADLSAVSCSAFGTGTWRCKAGAVTSRGKRVEVSRTPAGWRVRGWYSG